MNFIKNLFSKKTEAIKSYEDFWNWFRTNERPFFNVIKNRGDFEEVFFDKLSPKLNELKQGFFYLTGMVDEHTCELVITADGTVRNIVFVEELVSSAPKIDGWKFTALKPTMDIKGVDIQMAGHKFNSESLSFYPIEHVGYPDEIDLTIVYSDYIEENKNNIVVGTNIFLENYLGELELVETIDSISIIGKDNAENELIPISKLKDYLHWRQKEFIERYKDTRRDTENDSYSSYSATLENGNPAFAMINSDVLKWESKASHPWILSIEIKYDGENNGMPDEDTYSLLGSIEDKIMEDLKDFEGYINIGRETAENTRQIYFACRDFRKPSKTLEQIKSTYSNRLNIDYDIYKDKYWRTFNRYNQV